MNEIEPMVSFRRREPITLNGCFNMELIRVILSWHSTNCKSSKIFSVLWTWCNHSVCNLHFAWDSDFDWKSLRSSVHWERPKSFIPLGVCNIFEFKCFHQHIFLISQTRWQPINTQLASLHNVFGKEGNTLFQVVHL